MQPDYQKCLRSLLITLAFFGAKAPLIFLASLAPRVALLRVCGPQLRVAERGSFHPLFVEQTLLCRLAAPSSRDVCQLRQTQGQFTRFVRHGRCSGA